MDIKASRIGAVYGKQGANIRHIQERNRRNWNNRFVSHFQVPRQQNDAYQVPVEDTLLPCL
eukprot:CAMPEP_0172495254 /NCGR_PEP_ID=MMETSP1066-20121228/65965_1 /TAXON_ID=671091 /ORGANISM="Coscinodiscus wailesii, Strain CCMP2513" /LENGTH=60 /DNA_ID=CAMNT_0013266811 /DNA_START=17 /DNA_END=195 /DNA_ORIENTATION=+